MKKSEVAQYVAVFTFFDIFLLFIHWIAAMPGAVDACGRYSDEYDITRFGGVKGALFNWLSNMIEPITEGHDMAFGDFCLFFLFYAWMAASGVFAGIVLCNKKYNKSCPWALIIAQAVVTVYWAAYIGFVFLR